MIKTTTITLMTVIRVTTPRAMIMMTKPKIIIMITKRLS